MTMDLWWNRIAWLIAGAAIVGVAWAGAAAWHALVTP